MPWQANSMISKSIILRPYEKRQTFSMCHQDDCKALGWQKIARQD